MITRLYQEVDYGKLLDKRSYVSNVLSCPTPNY